MNNNTKLLKFKQTNKSNPPAPPPADPNPIRKKGI